MANPITPTTELLLVEPLHCTAEEILQWSPANPSAVHRYISCLEKGHLGQALIERYSYGQAPDAPDGMIWAEWEEPDGTGMKGWQPIKEEIKRELRGAIADNEPLIKADREAFMYVIENLADPQVEFLRELVEMIETGLRDMPKILVTILSTSGVEMTPTIDFSWHFGMEDAVTRLSEKILSSAVAEMKFAKIGRDTHVTYRMSETCNDQSAQALIVELRSQEI